jgi:Lambda phage tail tape-measure protein (Tape_meas_lam_C)
MAVTGWRAVTAALSDYASKAREIGGDIGQSLVGAFQSAENAVGEFVKIGKLNFRDLATSLLADLAKLAARRFILGPIANALLGVFAGAGGSSPVSCTRAGWSGLRAPRAWCRPSPSPPPCGCMAAVRWGFATTRSRQSCSARVLSRREAQAYGAGGVNVTIMARDVESFRQSRTQVAADIARAVSLGCWGL